MIHSIENLQAIAAKEERIVIGLNSGTSVDGIDAALVRIRGKGIQSRLELLQFSTFPYPDEVRSLILTASEVTTSHVEQICRLNIAVGECFADSVKRLVESSSMSLAEIDLIGSHGQTIQHLPVVPPIGRINARGTLQIGEPSLISNRTGIVTVADFRQADMALGGQGAPLVPYLDYVLFRSAQRNVGALNIGGIANITILKRGCRLDEVRAVDTGPGNMIIDQLMQRLFSQSFDDAGAVARSGHSSAALLEAILNEPFFSKPYPKSTGREDFGTALVNRILAMGDQLSLSKEDIVSTASMLTVESVLAAIREFTEPSAPLDEIIVSGGGAHNQFILQELEKRLAPTNISLSDDHGLPGDAKEAVLFALLASETIAGHPSNIPSVTGASRPAILGKICF